MKRMEIFPIYENDEQYNTVRNFKNKDFYLLRKNIKKLKK